MAIPVALATAYKERENIFRTIVYILAFAMVIYLLWKIFKAFQKLGKLDDAIKEAFKGLGESIGEIKQYGMTKPLTPGDTAEIITKRASKKPEKPYYVEKSIYDALKEQGYKLPENVKPVINVPKTETVEKYEQRPTIGSWTGIGSIGAYRRAIEEERAKEQKITPMTEKERVEYLGDYYTKMAIKNIESSRYYKIIWIDSKGLRQERIMKGADIKKLRGVSKVISITPMPSTYRPTPLSLPKPAPKSPADRILPDFRPLMSY